MKKIFYRFILIIIVLGMSGCSILKSEFQDDLAYDFGGRDDVTYFGNGRFQLWHVNKDYIIADAKNDVGIMAVERYLVEDDKIFIQGIVMNGWGVQNDGDVIYNSYDVNEGIEKDYDDYNEIPRFVILNYENETAEYYVDFEDVPDEYRNYFTSELPDRCEPLYSCFSADISEFYNEVDGS